VSKFIIGLDDVLRHSVKMYCPTTVEQAVEKARLQEVALKAIYRKHELPPENYCKSSSQVRNEPHVATRVWTEQSGPKQLYNSSKDADTEAVEGGQATDEDSDQRKKLEVEGKNGSEEADSKSIDALHLVVEKAKETQVKEIPTEETNLVVLSNFDPEPYGSIVVISPGVDQIWMMKEEKVAAIWLKSFDIEEGTLNMSILGIYILFWQQEQKQQNAREDGTKLRRKKKVRKKRRRINLIVKTGIG